MTPEPVPVARRRCRVSEWKQAIDAAVVAGRITKPQHHFLLAVATFMNFESESYCNPGDRAIAVRMMRDPRTVRRSTAWAIPAGWLDRVKQHHATAYLFACIPESQADTDLAAPPEEVKRTKGASQADKNASQADKKGRFDIQEEEEEEGEPRTGNHKTATKKQRLVEPKASAREPSSDPVGSTEPTEQGAEPMSSDKNPDPVIDLTERRRRAAGLPPAPPRPKPSRPAPTEFSDEYLIAKSRCYRCTQPGPDMVDVIAGQRHAVHRQCMGKGA